MTNDANEPVPESPCISVCVMDPLSGHCLGCFRTLDEIAAWPDLTPEEKQAVLDKLAAREGRGGTA